MLYWKLWAISPIYLSFISTSRFKTPFILNWQTVGSPTVMTVIGYYTTTLLTSIHQNALYLQIFPPQILWTEQLLTIWISPSVLIVWNNQYSSWKNMVTGPMCTFLTSVSIASCHLEARNLSFLHSAFRATTTSWACFPSIWKMTWTTKVIRMASHPMPVAMEAPSELNTQWLPLRRYCNECRSFVKSSRRWTPSLTSQHDVSVLAQYLQSVTKKWTKSEERPSLAKCSSPLIPGYDIFEMFGKRRHSWDFCNYVRP